jgi:hypothetical protein
MNSLPDDAHLPVQLTHLLMLSMEGLISEAQHEQMKKLLIENAEARAYYYDFIASYVAINSLVTSGDAAAFSPRCLDKDMWEELAAVEMNSPTIFLPKTPKETAVQNLEQSGIPHKSSKLSLVSLVMSAAAILFIVLFARFAPVRGKIVVARLSNTINANWEDATGQIVSGCDLFAGPMKLTQGLAEILMDNGAIVIIQAPSRFSLESPSQILLQQGKLVVKVDGASEQSFVVRSPHASIVDYGTEFGVRVDASGNTAAHVYQGKVELRSGANPLRFENRLLLMPNQAGQADTLGNLTDEQGLSGQFVRSEEFDIKLKASRGSGYHRWLAYSLRLRRDPDLAVYYTFEKDPGSPDILPNVADSTRGDLNGRFCSALENGQKPVWCEGRWPQKTALAFDRKQKQYVEADPDPRFSINGPITVAAWIYREADRDGGHIVANRVSPVSFCNYQLGYRSPSDSKWKHNIHLARKLSTDDSVNQISSTPLPDAFGWILVAATHDNETLKFYLNGNLVDTKYWPRKQELAEAGLVIGTDFAINAVDRFNGKIDEIAVLKRILTESEIAEMYQAGKP